MDQSLNQRSSLNVDWLIDCFIYEEYWKNDIAFRQGFLIYNEGKDKDSGLNENIMKFTVYQFGNLYFEIQNAQINYLKIKKNCLFIQNRNAIQKWNNSFIVLVKPDEKKSLRQK